MSSNYTYRTYELIVTYNPESQLWEGNCPKLGVKLEDISRGVLSSQFRILVNKLIKQRNEMITFPYLDYELIINKSQDIYYGSCAELNYFSNSDIEQNLKNDFMEYVDSVI